MRHASNSPSTVGLQGDPVRGTAENQAALTVRNLVKRFGDTVAVKDISLRVPSGLTFGLLGPSGSGKTTLLRLIGGFESPHEGTIELDGRDMAGVPPYGRAIGTVFQSYALFPHLTVADNIGFSLKQRGVTKANRQARVAQMLDVVGLQGYQGKYPRHLSGGQQQRVALARALIFEPRIVLMDEPLAALDRQLRKQMQQEIRSLQRRLGLTIVYVTHDQSEAFALSDLVAVINAGRIEQVGPPIDIYEAPSTEFVATFVGDSNIFCGESVMTEEGQSAIVLCDGRLLRYRSASRQQGRVRLLVRPEKIRLKVAGAPAESENAIRGEVADLRHMGDALIYRVRSGNLEVLVRQQNCSGTSVLAVGVSVTLCWNIADAAVLP